MQLCLNNTFQDLWQGKDPFDEVDRLEGQVFRRVKSRKTLRFTVNGRQYFAKVHYGIGWMEIAKDLLQFKRPVLGAGNEWAALNLLSQLGIEAMTPVAFGQKNVNPARQRSFIVTEELTDTVSLEDFCDNWISTPPAFHLRKMLIERVASMVSAMHRHGLNHRDCYICHFHLAVPPDEMPVDPDDLHLHVIDLHRAQIRRRVPTRWIVKDLAGLYFSAMDIGLTRTDCLRFMATYEQKPLREILRTRRRFWRRVARTAVALFRKHFGTTPTLRHVIP